MYFYMELIDFINKEKINRKLNNKKIISYFNKCLIKSVSELDKKFKKIKNKDNSVIAGLNMIYNIFFILIFYTNNIKLTIFLVERSILLYTEFIIMSQDKSVINEICFIPSITDAISFSYKKTIGPLNISSLNLKNNTSIIIEVFLTLKDIIIYRYIKDKEIIKQESNIENILLEIYTKTGKNDYFKINKNINQILNKNLNLEKELLKLLS